ncbi:MAG: hypothetical protein ACK5LO_06360 [Leucobacter sp.]
MTQMPPPPGTPEWQARPQMPLAEQRKASSKTGLWWGIGVAIAAVVVGAVVVAVIWVTGSLNGAAAPQAASHGEAPSSTDPAPEEAPATSATEPAEPAEPAEPTAPAASGCGYPQTFDPVQTPNWNGRVNDNNGLDYAVNLHFNATGCDLLADVSYSELGCSGNWTLVSREPTTDASGKPAVNLQFDERITSDPSNACAKTAEVTIYADSTGVFYSGEWLAYAGQASGFTTLHPQR